MGDNNVRPNKFVARLKSALSPSSTGSGSGESTAGKDIVSDKRREQIRRAQKTHRERKAQHIHRLQAELADLRTKDAVKAAEIKHQLNIIRDLMALLDQHQIPFSVPDLQADVSPITVSIVSHEQGISNSQHQTQSLQVGMPLESRNNNLLDDAQTGIDFVLGLEQPCLYHHHLPPADNDDAILGHSAMMQASIMSRGPELIDSDEPYLPEPASWIVPGEELERLLQFSNQIRLPNEITPVQVWSQIRSCASTGWLPNRQTLDELLQALAVHCSCSGFGAVLSKDIFEQVLQEYIQRS